MSTQRILLSFLAVCFVAFPLTDAKAEIIVAIDFEASSNGVATAANLNAGTTGATWSVNNIDDSIVRTGGGNRVFNPDNGPYDYSLSGFAAAPLAATTLSYDTYLQRTTNNTNAKKNFLTGFDSGGDEVFRLVLQTDGTNGGGATKKGRLSYVDASNTETHLISGLNSQNDSGYTNDELNNVRLEFNESGYDIYLDDALLAAGAGNRSPAANLDGLAELSFTSLPEGGSAGAFYDNFSIDVERVPEPSTIVVWLVSMSALGFVGWRRRRR